jgi:hypothetical protein
MEILADRVGGTNGIVAGNSPAPIIIDLGKAKRKRIRALKKGRGPLMQEVASVIEEVKSRMGDAASKDVIPIVAIYRQKRRRGKGRGLIPFLS